MFQQISGLQNPGESEVGYDCMIMTAIRMRLWLRMKGIKHSHTKVWTDTHWLTTWGISSYRVETTGMLCMLPIFWTCFCGYTGDLPRLSQRCEVYINMAAIWILLACFYMNAVLPGVRGKTDYYEVLGVTRSASNKDIKDSYKKLVKEWWVFYVE